VSLVIEGCDYKVAQLVKVRGRACRGALRLRLDWHGRWFRPRRNCNRFGPHSYRLRLNCLRYRLRLLLLLALPVQFER
jgi:hypothetical protein